MRNLTVSTTNLITSCFVILIPLFVSHFHYIISTQLKCFLKKIIRSQLPASMFAVVTSAGFRMISHLLPFTEPGLTIKIMSWVGWICHLPWEDSEWNFPSLFLGTKSHPRLGTHHRGEGMVARGEGCGHDGDMGLLAIQEETHTSSLFPSYLREWRLMREQLLICFTSPQFTVQPQQLLETAIGFFHPSLFHLPKIPCFFPSHRSNLFTSEPSPLRNLSW